MQLISTAAEDEETLRLKLPSRSVVVPMVVPGSITVAPTTGPAWSTTTPLTSYPPLWADTLADITAQRAAAAKRVRILFI